MVHATGTANTDTEIAKSTYNVGRPAGARPEITSLLLARATTVGLSDDTAAVAGWVDLLAVHACLEHVGRCFRHSDGAGREESEDGHSEGPHFVRIFAQMCRSLR
jgi:hypothetical protein